MVEPSSAQLAALALSPQEYRSAVEQLGRQPNSLELGMLAALWSEHCSYKTSRPLLGQLSSEGERVRLGPGENAGVIDLGQGLLCCFKVESHNHPSAVEPVQGAATGVGGILRDVFAMGARPVALLDAIRFGELSDRSQRHRFSQVVEGIGWYGNCIGVPTVGGETYFAPGYKDNCIVNAMCVGLASEGQLVHARASGPGNPVLLVGADTGRDGIHGATFASVQLDDAGEDRRPAVQVGNPFMEKCLLEACLELAGCPELVALQDCGAAGLTSSCAEMAHRGGVGIELDTALVPRRESGMSPYHVMLSESQERMVLVVEEGTQAAVLAVFRRWGLHCEQVGRVIPDPVLRVLDQGEPVAELPLSVLVDGVPVRHPVAQAPWEVREQIHRPELGQATPEPLEQSWRRLLGSPNCSDRSWVFRQYDQQVGDDTVVIAGSDAAVLRFKGRRDGLAISLDGAHRSGALDPERATSMAVAEGVANLACLGATPLAITNCLNFGDPDQPEVMWQLERAVHGLDRSARALRLPVVSGNVSLYNHYQGSSIPPTAVVGMVGSVPRVRRGVGPAFRSAGDRIVLVGPASRPGLCGSEHQRLLQSEITGGPPEVDLGLVARTAEMVRNAVRSGLARSAHDCSLGGLAVALTQCCLAGETGARVRLDFPSTPADPHRAEAWLFGEAPGRYLLSTAPAGVAELEARCLRLDVPLTVLGEVGGDRITIEGGGQASLALADAAENYRGTLPRAMGSG